MNIRGRPPTGPAPNVVYSHPPAPIPRAGIQPMLNQLLSRLTSASPRLKRLLWKQAYELLAKRYQKADWTFMNYGYAPVDPSAATPHLKAEDEPDRYSIQLYHHLVSAVEM